jgi:beta-glucosidase/6-phospho-beta-glucosidase/beta-galactosidase
VHVISTPLGELSIGIPYVDDATRKRTPKLSVPFYKAVIAGNGVV